MSLNDLILRRPTVVRQIVCVLRKCPGRWTSTIVNLKVYGRNSLRSVNEWAASFVTETGNKLIFVSWHVNWRRLWGRVQLCLNANTVHSIVTCVCRFNLDPRRARNCVNCDPRRPVNLTIYRYYVAFVVVTNRHKCEFKIKRDLTCIYSIIILKNCRNSRVVSKGCQVADWLNCHLYRLAQRCYCHRTIRYFVRSSRLCNATVEGYNCDRVHTRVTCQSCVLVQLGVCVWLVARNCQVGRRTSIGSKLCLTFCVGAAFNACTTLYAVGDNAGVCSSEPWRWSPSQCIFVCKVVLNGLGHKRIDWCAHIR